MIIQPRSRLAVRHLALTSMVAVLLAVVCSGAAQDRATDRSFPTPEDAVRALIAAAKADGMEPLLAIFGPEGRELVESSDPATTRRNRQVFTAAAAERWSLQEPSSEMRVLVIGNEGWPFPVPLVNDASGWRFDTVAGKEEVLSRRIGRNELAVIEICRTYVAAQRIYAASGHDGRASGIYAMAFRSDPGKQNGLYWPAAHGQRRSPLGDLVAEAATEGHAIGERTPPAPFHGYFFKILTAQGAAAPGGAKDYVADGRLSGGFALVAWPAQYGVTGIMTFVVNHDDDLRETDLGHDTATIAKAMRLYDPNDSWTIVPR
jgi:hypothetical protein